ncbi:MAG: DUF4126 domain-containing protein [Xanthomonadales bacterium]|nr:DUF4126 domain-containing protein [Xanthomonadales bacterium]
MDGVSEIGAFSALMAGICLSAAAGLRVFIPLLALGLAGRMELLPLGEQFAWMTSEPFLIVVGVAAMLEAGAYYIPLVDNMLDVFATPAALAGGTVIVSSLLPEMNPVAQWTTAALLGGGTAGIVQTGTVLTRGASTVTSAGLANPLVATGETGGSLLAVALAIFVPVFFGVALVIGLVALVVWIVRRLAGRRQSGAGNEPMQPPH